MNGATLWPSSEYAAKCDACGGAIGSVEPRVRENERGIHGRRSWHPACYEKDPQGQATIGVPRVAAVGPRVPRVPPAGSGIPPATPPSASTSVSGAPSPTPTSATASIAGSASAPDRSTGWVPREAGWTWVTVEATCEFTGGAKGTCKLSTIVPNEERDETAFAFREYAAGHAVLTARVLVRKAQE